MCTAITYKTKDCYFGRTLDYEFSYGDEVVITPRKYEFKFKYQGIAKNHYAIIGMAHVINEYPLYYEAMNEKGLGIAGLNFVNNAYYRPKIDNKINVTQYEFIPFILGNCSNVGEALKIIKNINITNDQFDNLPLASLHWIISDSNSSITLEIVKDGVKIYDNKIGILTNNPQFDIQMLLLNNYIGLSNKQVKNNFSSKIEPNLYSRGMGAIGLPGDLSSQSRFVRAAFVKLNSVSRDDEASSVNQFFHILGSVEQQRGCCMLDSNKYEITIYTSCMNLDKGLYYYKTYDDFQIKKVNLFKENLDSKELIKYEVLNNISFYEQN